ncbi:MAG: polyprenol monophosphomannose synthase [Myxococcales bacterium]|jgi:dolichol-phosphate mannosyltransferase|nr:MAG: polyprenol monophosphomannose synthase [Myxococcales bacterium]
MKPQKKIVVVPTYNERENLGAIVGAILDVDPENEVLVVDDNSPDGTGRIADDLSAADARVHVLHRPGKEGIGPAYKSGFQRALDLGADLVVQMDADFSHSPDDLRRFYDEAVKHDVVLGSRYVDGVTVVNWPMARLMLSYYGNRYARRVLGCVPIEDLTGGFKCWRRETLDAIDLPAVRSNGYAFQIEMSYRAWRMGYRLKEIPIIFTDRKLGDSKMNKRIAVEALGVVWWLRAQSLLGRLETRPALGTTREVVS